MLKYWNNSQLFWKPILRTFLVLASCAMDHPLFSCRHRRRCPVCRNLPNQGWERESGRKMRSPAIRGGRREANDRSDSPSVRPRRPLMETPPTTTTRHYTTSQHALVADSTGTWTSSLHWTRQTERNQDSTTFSAVVEKGPQVMSLAEPLFKPYLEGKW